MLLEILVFYGLLSIPVLAGLGYSIYLFHEHRNHKRRTQKKPGSPQPDKTTTPRPEGMGRG